MDRRISGILASALISGLVMGQAALANDAATAEHHEGDAKAQAKGKNGCKGHAKKKKGAKNACDGKNGCKAEHAEEHKEEAAH